MKNLILYDSSQTKKEIADICNNYDISNWSINSEGLVDVDGDVNIYSSGLDKLPLKFGTVTGNFNCGFNKLTSLEGGPKYVGGTFYGQHNKIKSLESSPREVGHNFYCYNNHLTSLEGGPIKVGGYFDCSSNKLVSLEGGPKKVNGNFNCSNNNLTSLEGGPKYVGGNFACRYNELVSLEGVPDFVSGSFECIGNLIYRIWELFEDYSKIELFNYYDIVRELDGKPAIVLARLNQFLDDIGKPPVKKVEGYIYI